MDSIIMRKTIINILMSIAVVASLTNGVTAGVSSRFKGPAVHPSAEGISIAIDPQSIIASAGDPVYIDVYLKNNRDTVLTLPEPHEAEQMLSLTVRHSDGTPAHLTDFGAAHYFKPDYARHLTMQQYTGMMDPATGLIVQPGKALHFKILLSRLYDLTKEDLYFVNVSQWIPNIGGSGYSTLVSTPSDVHILNGSNQSLTPETTNPSDPGRTEYEWPVGSQF